MCQLASFFWKRTESEGTQVRVWNLTRHSETQKYLKLTERAGWYEGHYLPTGEIECRIPDGTDTIAEQDIKDRWSDFYKFLNWALEQKLGRDLNLSGCTGLTTLPTGLKVGGYLSLFGCTGLTTLPTDLKVGGDLDISGCTGLRKVVVPKGVKGQVYRYR